MDEIKFYIIISLLSEELLKLKSIFLPRVAKFIYIEGDNKRVGLLLELYILFITRL